jgi:hypothetical protein
MLADATPPSFDYTCNNSSATPALSLARLKCHTTLIAIHRFLPTHRVSVMDTRSGATGFPVLVLSS